MPGAPGAASTTGAAVSGLGIALLLALAGGLILNLMPCVFPVIGLKVMGFMHDAGGHPARARLHSAVFSLGIVLSFMALAVVMLGLRAAGESIGWGFQLQSPPFVAMLALLFVAVGLNFAGVFHLGARLTQLGGITAPTVPGSFGAGVLATVAATPCTAPFMGSAIGFTLERSAPEVLLVFAVLGAGMALPYLGLGLSPALLRWLPRPGAWMESFKQALAFPMFAAVAWLAWVLALQIGVNPLLWLLVACTVLAAALWVFGRWRSPSARGIAAALAALAVWLAWPGPAEPGAQRQGGTASASSLPASWESYSDAGLAAHIAAGRPVFVDFTAAWCISCQVNKKLALESDAVLAAFDALGIVRMRADWTNRDPEITAALARHGRNGVPLYLVYGRSGAVTVLPELLTPGLVLDALNRAASG
ncbi:MAG: thioredoxin family protein [Burkholderiales bacterium]|nr:MAG: thioredoxin family protein [Burkholderiales bacterium]